MGVAVAALEAETRVLGIANAVEIHDMPDQATLRALVGHASAYACASEYEGFGLAAIEVCRPLPYIREPQPRLSDVAGDLLSRDGEADPVR